jgi:hypothetical protein
MRRVPSTRQHTGMDSHARPPVRDTPDLAAIVLADAPARRGRTYLRGYDARSVLLLTLVVAVLAAVVAGTMTFGSSRSAADAKLPGGSPIGAVGASGSSSAAAQANPGAGAEAGRSSSTASTAASPVPGGVALAVGRITATPNVGHGSMVIRVAVTNTGTSALLASSGARLLVLLDDQIVGNTGLQSTQGHVGHSTYSLTVPSCTTGRHVVTAITDPSSRVRDAVGSNGARSTELTLVC